MKYKKDSQVDNCLDGRDFKQAIEIIAEEMKANAELVHIEFEKLAQSEERLNELIYRYLYVSTIMQNLPQPQQIDINYFLKVRERMVQSVDGFFDSFNDD